MNISKTIALLALSASISFAAQANSIDSKVNEVELAYSVEMILLNNDQIQQLKSERENYGKILNRLKQEHTKRIENILGD